MGKRLTTLVFLAGLALTSLTTPGCTAPKVYGQRFLAPRKKPDAGDYIQAALLWYPLVTIGNFGVPIITDPVDELFRPKRPTAWWDCVYEEERSQFTKCKMGNLWD